MKFFKYFFLILFVFTSYDSRAGSFLEGKVRKIKLDNGLTCLLVKREGAPIFSAYLRVKVGGIEEMEGATGLAHFFEHMAFKGTPNIGVRDYKAEKVILKKMHEIGSEIVKQKKAGATPEKLKELKDELEKLSAENQKLIVKNEFVNIFQRNGGTDLNATTSNDYTSFFVSLPASMMELYAYMESSRLIDPVYREFYTERDVVYEERRMRVDDDPEGQLYEAFLSKAFATSPYGTPVIGWPEDIQNFVLENAKAFHKTYYIPSRMTLAIVGNFDVDEAEKIVRQYFGKLQKKEDVTKDFPKEVLDDRFPLEHTITGKDEPRFYMGYHRPAYPDPDDEIFDVIESVLCEGRTSRLYQRLVKEKHMTSDIGCSQSMPGARLDGLFTFYAKPLKPYSNEDVRKIILEEVEKIKQELVADAELKKVVNQLDAGMIWALKDNMGLASMLTFFESLTGDWKYVDKVLDKIHAITPADIQRVAQKYFVPGRQVTVFYEKK